MSKRFRDTGLWDKDWYVGLSCAERCAVDYIFCRCDAVGVWAPAFNTADKLIGEKVDWKSLPGKMNGNIQVLANSKWWLKDFCKYQYGTINAESESKVQKSLHSLLICHGLWDSYLSTLTPTVDSTVQDKDKEKDKDKVKDKDKGEVRVVDVIEYLNKKTGRRYRVTPAHSKHISARIREGYSLTDFVAVIDAKVKQWGNDAKMSEYLRPETLFSNKFDGYLAGIVKPKASDDMAWICGSCGAKYRSTAATCSACGWERE